MDVVNLHFVFVGSVFSTITGQAVVNFSQQHKFLILSVLGEKAQKAIRTGFMTIFAQWRTICLLEVCYSIHFKQLRKKCHFKRSQIFLIFAQGSFKRSKGSLQSQFQSSESQQLFLKKNWEHWHQWWFISQRTKKFCKIVVFQSLRIPNQDILT